MLLHVSCSCAVRCRPCTWIARESREALGSNGMKSDPETWNIWSDKMMCDPIKWRPIQWHEVYNTIEWSMIQWHVVNGPMALNSIQLHFCLNSPSINTFLISDWRRTCHVPEVTENSLTPKGDQNSLTSQGNNNYNFRLAHDRVVHLENAKSLWVGGVQLAG